MNNCCTLGFRGLQVQVHSNVSAPLTWLNEFMLPALRAQEPVLARREIRLIIDGQRFASMLSVVRAEHQNWVDCFTKDGGFEQLSAWRDQSGREILYSELGHCFLVPKADGGAIELVAAADHGMMRRCLMRLVRELAMMQALYRGDLFVHGAAVVCRDEAIVVTGARRAGKTSMLLNALRQGGVWYLSNDRVFIEAGMDRPTVHGMPTIITVRAECFAHLPGLTVPTWGYPYRHYLTMRECEARSPLVEAAFQDPPAMNPPQFCRWMGVEMATHGPLRAVVLPRVDTTVTGYKLDRLSLADAEVQLCANLFSAGPTGPVPAALVQDGQAAMPIMEGMRRGCRDVSRKCSVFTCRIGPAAFGSPNVWNAIVSAAFEGV